MYVCMHVCMYVCWKIAIYLDAQEVEKLIIIDLLTYQVPENLYITVIIHPFQHTLVLVISEVYFIMYYNEHLQIPPPQRPTQ